MSPQPDEQGRWQAALAELLASSLSVLADDGALAHLAGALTASIVSAASVAEPQSKFQVRSTDFMPEGMTWHSPGRKERVLRLPFAMPSTPTIVL